MGLLECKTVSLLLCFFTQVASKCPIKKCGSLGNPRYFVIENQSSGSVNPLDCCLLYTSDAADE